MPDHPTPADILLKLSFVEGFTARHLAWLAAVRNPAAARPVDGPPPNRSLLQKGIEAAGSGEAGERTQEVRAACARAGVRIVPLGSDGYPPLLAGIVDAPLVLYWWGSGTPCGETVGIVGSRAPTDVGKEFARGLAADLSLRGITVVSGMARGIDAAAHEGALQAGGKPSPSSAAVWTFSTPPRPGG